LPSARDGGGIDGTIFDGFWASAISFITAASLSAVDQIIGIMLVIEVIGLIADKSHAPRHSRSRSGLGGMPRAGRAAVGAMRR